jgi:flagellar hook-associated protein 3 FlgL
MLATEVRQLRSGLLAIANRDDGNGRSLFAGSQSHVVPFSDSAGRVSYAGDDGQNLVDVAPDQALADTNAGSDVFLRVRSGDGDIRGRALPGNTGGGVLQGTAVTDHASWNGRTLRLEFTAPDSWRVLDAGGATIGSGSYAPGDSIDAGGVQVRLSGTPASGDAFMLEPAPNQDIFSTLQSLADALVAPAGTPVDQARLNNAMGSAITDLDTAQNHLSMVRADTGARLSALADGADTRAAQDESLRSSLSQLRDVDYAQAASQLSLQMTALDAAQRTLLKVQSLSLFDQL